ncbi:UNVERIFIED_CONTAM: Retrovirus-related Pol polyprotein from transposon TNT 1-94 [Sesamum radiatum]|uniref:Retrovirus-related Pol polyprotein from transposon TNT 1-94 n=1 Tax=Sesamum radiatum TaxID=300843 RepID=A0AAW2UAW0_SESRA
MIPKETPPQQQEEDTEQAEMKRRSQQAPGSPRRPPLSEETEEETLPRRAKLLSDIYETCNSVMMEPENFEAVAKHKVCVQAMEEEIKMIERTTHGSSQTNRRQKSNRSKMDLQDQAEYSRINRETQGLIHSKRIFSTFRSTNIAKLVGYTDSDWAGSTDDMKSTSRYTFSLCSGIFSWASKKQATVAQSLAEAEYIATAATSNQATWLRRILDYVGEKQEEPTIIYCDKMSGIAITKNSVQHNRTKHINIKYHSFQEATTKGEIELKYYSAEEQLADMFTKALPCNKFEELRTKIGVCHKYIKGDYKKYLRFL